MSTFVASNTTTISKDNESLEAVLGNGVCLLQPWTVKALREFFQHERDEELGRWRWPDTPVYVVYRDSDNSVLVFDETNGRSEQYARWEAELLEDGAAFDYFAAHPEPKPWERAKPGEIWELTAEGVERQYAAIASRDFTGDAVYLFPVDDAYAPKLGLRAPVITDGRRIWPEPS